MQVTAQLLESIIVQSIDIGKSRDTLLHCFCLGVLSRSCNVLLILSIFKKSLTCNLGALFHGVIHERLLQLLLALGPDTLIVRQ